MSVEYLKRILTENSGIVCLLGRAPAIKGGCDFYREDYAYEIETKYGRSPGEIFSSSFYRNRPKAVLRVLPGRIAEETRRSRRMQFCAQEDGGRRKASGNYYAGIFQSLQDGGLQKCGADVREH